MKGTIRKNAKAFSLSTRIIAIIELVRTQILKDFSVFKGMGSLIKLAIRNLVADSSSNDALRMMVKQDKLYA